MIPLIWILEYAENKNLYYKICWIFNNHTIPGEIHNKIWKKKKIVQLVHGNYLILYFSISYKAAPRYVPYDSSLCSCIYFLFCFCCYCVFFFREIRIVVCLDGCVLSLLNANVYYVGTRNTKRNKNLGEQYPHTHLNI